MVRLSADRIYSIENMVSLGYISRRYHPSHPDISILNYTHKAQIESMWNPATIMCRGLIVDSDWTILGRPFRKFFTIDQLTSLRNSVHNLYGRKFKEIFDEEFVCYDKIDGSLGIIWYNRYAARWEIATRGSFESEQAIEADKILTPILNEMDFQMNMRDDPAYLHIGYTYLVEIIYPENQIVVNYNNRRDLILIGAINNRTGQDDWQEFEKAALLFSYAKTFPYTTFAELERAPIRDNAEGFVLVFKDGFRLKYKYAEYSRLHKILTNCSEKSILEAMRRGSDLHDFLNNVPDEFYNWVTQVSIKFEQKYLGIEVECTYMFDSLKCPAYDSRKEFALAIQDYKYKSILFAMLDGKDYSKMIWDIIEKEL